MTEDYEPRIAVPGLIALLMMIAGVILGLIVGSQTTLGTMQREAIEHGAAHYDAKTAKWTWNTEKP